MTDDLTRRARMLCRRAEPHRVTTDDEPCALHVNRALIQLAAASTPATDGSAPLGAGVLGVAGSKANRPGLYTRPAEGAHARARNGR